MPWNGWQAPHIFHEHCAFIASPIIVSQCWHETPRVHLQQGLRLFIRIYFNVLIRNALQFKCDPDTLHERAGGRSSSQQGIDSIIRTSV
jgi:hypothetical protein